MGNINNSIEHLVSIYRDVANAIRAKAGTSSTITPDDFAQQILNIPTSGGDSVEWVPYTLTLLKQATISANYGPFSFEDNVWYFYDSIQETFIQQDPPKTLIDSTILEDNFYIKIIEQETFDKILLAISDTKILLTADINDTSLDIISDWLTTMELHTSSKLASLNDLALSLSFTKISIDRDDDDILISNNDNANTYPTIALSSIAGNTTKSLWLDKDIDTNYLLDNIFGISDIDEEYRAFSPIEDIVYDYNTNNLSWTSCYQVQDYVLKFYVDNQVVSSVTITNPTYTKYSDQNEHEETTLVCSYDTLGLTDYDASASTYIDLEASGPRCFTLALPEKLSAPINTNPAPEVTARYIHTSGDSGWISNIELTFTANEAMDLKLKADNNRIYQDLPNVYGQNTITISMQDIIDNNYKYFYLCRPTQSKLASVSNMAYTYYFNCVPDFIKEFKLETAGDDAGYYISYNHDHGGYSYCKINFNCIGVAKLRITYLQYSEQNYDYALFSKLGVALSQNINIDTSDKLSKNCAGEIKTAESPGIFYIDIPSEAIEFSSFITVKYRHDGSGMNMPDRIAFKIEPVFWYEEN